MQLAQTLANLPKEATMEWNAEMGIGIAGLLIALVGLAGLVSLWPSILVEPLPPIDAAQPFSVPFKITNSGFLPIKNLKPYCYLHWAKVAGNTFSANLSSNDRWNAEYLARGEAITIITNFIHSNILPSEADLAIVVDYNPFGVPFKTMRSVSRFVGQFGNTWQWLQQASRPIRADIHRSIGYWALGRH